MAVEVRFIRRLGNNLFQYCLGRIIAEALGYELICVWPGPPSSVAHHERTSGLWATLPGLARHFPGAPLHLSGKSVATPQERYVFGERNWSGQGIPLRAILETPDDRRIVLSGFFQRMEYYTPYRDKIRTWLKPAMVDCGLSPQRNDVVVNIRRGLDYFVDDWVLSPGYYLQALETMKPTRVYVCGVGIDDTIRRTLKGYHPIYYEGTPIEEYHFISRFKRIILSNSTFAWWAAWISDAEQIVFPRCRCYWGNEFPDVDLEVNEQRYVYIDDVRTEPWRPMSRNRAMSINVRDSALDNCVLVSVGEAGDAEEHRFSSFVRPAVEWMADRTEPFGMVDLLPFVDPREQESEEREARWELRNVIAVLIRDNALSADALCLDWLAHR